METGEMYTGESSAASHGPGMAELTISQIYVQPQTINAGDPVVLGAVVRNQGTVATGPFFARFSLDVTREIFDMEMPNIEPGASYWRDWEHAPLEAGDYTFYVSLDPEHQVPEINRYGNNSTHTKFTVNPAATVTQDVAVTDTADAKVKEISFDDEPITIEVPVTHVGKGRTGTQEIDQLLDNLKGRVRDHWTNYSQGLIQFTNRMQFSSEQEAAPQYLDATFKAVGKQALEIGLGKLGEELGGPWGKIIGTLKAVGEAWVAEQERVEAAEGEVKIVSYIEGLGNGIGPRRDEMIGSIEAEHIPLADYFKILLDRSMSSTEEGNITGDAAEFLTDLRQRVDRFKQAIPSAAQFQEDFTEKFADTPVMTDLISHGGRMAGNLRIRAQITVRDNQWDVDEIEDEWTLVTVAPKPERLAAGLQSALANQGKKPWQSDLEKIVQLTINMNDGYIVFTHDPLQFEPRSNYSLEPFESAWKSSRVRERVLGVSKIVGSND
ncbi:MAG: hypothetical protein HY782_24650 [Chloroflexi bacterium]|nr:hypothetical protein [Chloroflexota bacterium]